VLLFWLTHTYPHTKHTHSHTRRHKTKWRQSTGGENRLKCNHGFELLLGHTFNPSQRSRHKMAKNGQRSERESKRLACLSYRFTYTRRNSLSVPQIHKNLRNLDERDYILCIGKRLSSNNNFNKVRCQFKDTKIIQVSLRYFKFSVKVSKSIL